MHKSLYSLIRSHSVVSIIGMCKNAGKTTTLNRIVRETATVPVTLGLTSIGRDGEDTDVVTGTHKPSIWVRRGTLVATATGVLPYCDITREIIATTGIHTPMGEVVLLRALSDGFIQIAGPSMIAQLEQLAPLMQEYGAGMVLIDGAISRKSFSTHTLSDAAILCTGASCGPGVDTVVANTAFYCRLMLLPRCNDAALPAAVDKMHTKALLAGRELVALGGQNLAAALREHQHNENRCLFIDGAVTDAALKPLVSGGLDLSGLAVVARDASKLLVSPQTLERLAARKARLEVLESVNLAAVTVNPFSATGNHFDKDEFLRRMAESVPVPVMNVEEG